LTHYNTYHKFNVMNGDTGRKLIIQLADEQMTSITDLFVKAGLNASIGTKFINQTVGAADNLAPATYKKLADAYPTFARKLQKSTTEKLDYMRVEYSHIIGVYEKMVAVAMPENQYVSIPTGIFNAEKLQQTFKCISWGKNVTVPFYEGSYGFYRETDCREMINSHKVPMCIMITEEKTIVSYCRKAILKGKDHLDVMYANGEHAFMIPFDDIINVYAIEIFLPHIINYSTLPD